jgi:hypothetical protein
VNLDKNEIITDKSVKRLSNLTFLMLQVNDEITIEGIKLLACLTCLKLSQTYNRSRDQIIISLKVYIYPMMK